MDIQNDFHLKSSFDKTKYILIRVFGNVIVIFNFIFQILRLFVWHMEFALGETYPLGLPDLVYTAPSIDTWSMAEKLWHVHEMFIFIIYFYFKTKHTLCSSVIM